MLSCKCPNMEFYRHHINFLFSMQKIKKMDRELAEQLFSGELNEDEIKELLARNRANIERLRLEREAKRLKSLDLMREKKNRKKHQAADEVSCGV